jgi:hypothetical protein
LVIFLKLSAVNPNKNEPFNKKNVQMEINSPNDPDFTWEVDLTLNDLKSLFNEIIKFNNNRSKFNDLTQHLRQINKIIENLLSNLMIELISRRTSKNTMNKNSFNNQSIILLIFSR